MKTIIENWQKNNKPFLIENERTYSYESLGKVVLEDQHTIQKILSKLLSNRVYICESKNCLKSYSRFLALLSLNQTVMLVSCAQYNDSDYMKKLQDELKLPVGLWGLSASSINCDTENESVSSRLSERPQFIVRTSGSSGKKFKLVLHDLHLFLEKYKKVGPHFKKTLAFSPAESIAGIETLLETIVHELTLVTPEDNLNPTLISQIIKDHNVDYFQTTPTYMNLMMMSGVVSKSLIGGLQKIAFGSEPSQLNVLNFFKAVLPDIELLHTYGMTEIGIQKTITSKIDPTYIMLDKKFNRGKIFEDILEVESMTKMIGYLNDSEDQSKLGSTWFKTFDQAISGEDLDYLKVIGRVGDLINVAGIKFFPSELEDKIKMIEGVADVTVTQDKNEMIGSVVIANIVLKPNVEEKTFRLNFKNYCQEHIINYMHPHRVKISYDLELAPRLKKMRNL